MIKRQNEPVKYIIQEKDKIKKVSKVEFDSKNNIAGIIRIHEKDYPLIPTDTPYFTHFNLEMNKHEIGKIYALPSIIKPGYLKKNGEEILPVLSFEECYISECIAVKQKIPYEKLTSQDFQYSLENVKNIDDLKKEILFRYSISMPDLTKKKIVSLGVAITKIKIAPKLKILKS